METPQPRPATELESFTERARHLHEHLFGKKVVMVDKTETTPAELQEPAAEAEQ